MALRRGRARDPARVGVPGGDGAQEQALPPPAAVNTARLRTPSFAGCDSNTLSWRRESDPADSEVVTTPDRGLPAVLEEGSTVSLSIYVGDDVDSARRDRKLRPPELTLRFESFCTDDSIEMRLNGVSLDVDEA